MDNTKSKATLATIVAVVIILSTISVSYLSFEKADGSAVSAVTSVSQGDSHHIKHHILFKDDYSSNVGWTQIGTSVTVNSPFFPGIVKWNNEMGEGGAGDDRVYKQLPITLPSHKWTTYFDYQFTASSLVRSWIFDLSATPTDPWFLTSTDIITVEHGFEVDQLVVERGPRGDASAGIPISPNTQYYVKLERVPTQLILSVFSDPARTVNVPGSPVTLDIAKTDYNGDLKFIQHDGCSACGPARTLTAQLDNTLITSP